MDIPDTINLLHVLTLFGNKHETPMFTFVALALRPTTPLPRKRKARKREGDALNCFFFIRILFVKLSRVAVWVFLGVTEISEDTGRACFLRVAIRPPTSAKLTRFRFLRKKMMSANVYIYMHSLNCSNYSLYNLY